MGRGRGGDRADGAIHEAVSVLVERRRDSEERSARHQPRRVAPVVPRPHVLRFETAAVAAAAWCVPERGRSDGRLHFLTHPTGEYPRDHRAVGTMPCLHDSTRERRRTARDPHPPVAAVRDAAARRRAASEGRRLRGSRATKLGLDPAIRIVTHRRDAARVSTNLTSHTWRPQALMAADERLTSHVT